VKRGDYGILGPAALFIGIGFITCCWPSLVWHGYTDAGGWRWDIHSTAACAVWWGVLVFLAFLCWLGGKPAAGTTRPARGPLTPPPGSVAWPAPPPPPCAHLNAVKVDSLDGSEVYCCWCPGCDKDDLPANFRRPCCGTEPGNPHWYSCPERKR
jgi:hypothetical protein